MGCGCTAWIRMMDKQGPEWCRKHVKKIVEKLRREARNRGWRLALAIPGHRFPIWWMVMESIWRSERDIKAQAERQARRKAKP